MPICSGSSRTASPPAAISTTARCWTALISGRRSSAAVWCSSLPAAGDPVWPAATQNGGRCGDAIGGLAGSAGHSGDPLHDHGERRAERVRAVIAAIPRDGGSRADFPDDEQLECHRRAALQGYGWGRNIYARMAWDRSAPTITGGCINPSKGRFLHPEEDRAITVREALLLQGFPANHRVSLRRGKYAAAELAGNAIPPVLRGSAGADSPPDAHRRSGGGGMNGPTDIHEILRQELTDEQRAAATDESADVLVIACAGSGKSRTLAYRIAWLISRGADPASIVAFTFTDKAADAIQQRVATALQRTGRPSTEVGKIRIGTIHGFCHEMLVRVDARYRQFDVLDQNGLHLFLISRYPELGIQRFQDRAQRYFAKITGLADAWANLHDEVLDLEEVTSHDRILGETLARLRDSLDRANYIDFSSMIRLIVDRLRAGDPATLGVIGGVRHLLVDEYQDTNPLQEQLIQALRSKCETLTVVGDDDQSIYGWRGANVQNILDFHDRNPEASRHTLAHNFRSTPLIVRSADAFVRAEIGANRLSKSPAADLGEGPHQLGVFGFEDRRTEAEWVAGRISALRGSAYHDGERPRGLTHGRLRCPDAIDGKPGTRRDRKVDRVHRRA